jgi:small-conductance mechanosensitive channel
MAAIVLSVLASGWIYAEAPRVLSAALGIVLLVPTVVLLRGLVEPPLRIALGVLSAVFIVDIVEGLAEGIPLVSRVLLLGVSTGLVLVLAWALARREGFDDSSRNGKGLRLAAVAALGVSSVAILANVLGYVTLARLVAGAGLESAFVGMLLYATVRIVDGLAMFALRVQPLSSLRIVASHRLLLRRRFVGVLRWAAGALWLVVTLERFEVRKPVFAAVGSVLSTSLSVGAIHVSIGDVLLFTASVWGAFLLSRFLRFVLEEDVYPRAELGRGIPYAVSTVAHYALLVAGFVFALGAVGVDMTRFTILASAFGVGLGFGLQNIFNNFVSGLILLVERPVNVGDVVEVEGQTGDLRRIGLRASVVRTANGSEVIVPNGSLISEKVINWTLSDQKRRLEVRVGVAYGTEPERVLALLAEVAASHPDVLEDPAPQALFEGFGDSALEFLLRAWTDHFDRWPLVRSELTVRMNAALRDAGIEIPFPQREVRLRAVTPEVVGEIEQPAKEVAHRELGRRDELATIGE